MFTEDMPDPERGRAAMQHVAMRVFDPAFGDTLLTVRQVASAVG